MRLLLAAFLMLALGASAQDYEREQRWASQIVPSLVVGDAVTVKSPGRRDFLGIYTEAPGSKAAVLLVHGVGVHPDHGLIGVLRVALADAGYTTLSIQMPVQKPDAKLEDYYPTVFPEAVARITAAGRFLLGRGHARIVLLSHSMGSWMSSVYYEDNAESPFAAWVCIGLTGRFGGMRNVRVPVLDAYGEHDLPQVLRAERSRADVLASLPGSRQAKIAAADHHFTGREKQLEAAVRAFIEAQVVAR